MPILPDFTIHDLIKKEESKTKIQQKDEAKGLGLDVDDVNKDTFFFKEHISKDEWGMTPVIGSSNIKEIGWKDNKCRVKFYGDKLFEFTPVGQSLYFNFLASKSKGQFFDANIKKNRNIKATRIL